MTGCVDVLLQQHASGLSNSADLVDQDLCPAFGPCIMIAAGEMWCLNANQLAAGGCSRTCTGLLLCTDVSLSINRDCRV